MPTFGSESTSLRTKVLIYLHAVHKKEKFKETGSLWEKWLHLQPAVGKWRGCRLSLTLIPGRWKKSPTAVPNHNHKDLLAPPSSSSRAAPEAGEGSPSFSGFPPHAGSPPGWEDPRSGRTGRRQNLGATSSEPAQGADDGTRSVSAGTA